METQLINVTLLDHKTKTEDMKCKNKESRHRWADQWTSRVTVCQSIKLNTTQHVYLKSAKSRNTAQVKALFLESPTGLIQPLHLSQIPGEHYRGAAIKPNASL